MPHLHRAPTACPVCAERLVTTRLGCQACGTELVGSFEPCPFCALDAADLDLLKVFLVSRGNLKELEKHLGVSYPTARARFAAVLDRLGWADAAGADPDAGSDHGDRDPEAAEPSGGEHAADDASRPDGEPDPGTDHGDGPAASGTHRPVGDGVRDEVLAQVAAGVLSPAVAADLLRQLS